MIVIHLKYDVTSGFPGRVDFTNVASEPATSRGVEKRAGSKRGLASHVWIPGR